MDKHERYLRNWPVLRPIVTLFMKAVFNLKAEKHSVEGPYLVLCNHVMDLDPLAVGVGMQKQMYFVASEHIMRLGLISRVLDWLVGIITRQKGGSAAGTVKAILRHLKDGHNVCFFPEGNRTWDGVTRSFPASTGKLVRSCGCTLVTYRLSGGYFSNPRWAGGGIRRGRLTGQLVGTYKAEELRKMSVEEINAIIARDLHVDAYDIQREVPVKFHAFNRAHHLETLLFTCPKCGAMHKMRSHGHKFRCESCGMETAYRADCFFEGGELPFDNVRDWNAWQEEQIRALCESAGDEPIFTDTQMCLRLVDSAKDAELIGTGSMALYRDRLELPGGVVLQKDEISGMSLRGAINLYIGTGDGRHYELKSKQVRCTVKYLSACGYLGCNVGVGV